MNGDAPGEYNHISDEVKSLHSLIEGVQHLEMAALSCSQQQDGKEILQGCQNALEDLDEFIEKHKRLKINKVTRFKLGLKNMMGLRIRLISNTLLLFVFIQSCSQGRIEDSQTRMEDTQSDIKRLLLENTFLTGSINTRKALKELGIKLHQNGVRGEMIKLKQPQVLDLFLGENISISPAVGVAVKKEGGQSQATNDHIISSTTSPTPTNTNLSRNAIRFCISAGTLLAGAWIAWSVLSG